MSTYWPIHRSHCVSTFCVPLLEAVHEDTYARFAWENHLQNQALVNIHISEIRSQREQRGLKKEVLTHIWHIRQFAKCFKDSSFMLLNQNKIWVVYSITFFFIGFKNHSWVLIGQIIKFKQNGTICTPAGWGIEITLRINFAFSTWSGTRLSWQSNSFSTCQKRNMQHKQTHDKQHFRGIEQGFYNNRIFNHILFVSWTNHLSRAQVRKSLYVEHTQKHAERISNYGQSPELQKTVSRVGDAT